MTWFCKTTLFNVFYLKPCLSCFFGYLPEPTLPTLNILFCFQLRMVFKVRALVILLNYSVLLFDFDLLIHLMFILILKSVKRMQKSREKFLLSQQLCIDACIKLLKYSYSWRIPELNNIFYFSVLVLLFIIALSWFCIQNYT